MILKNIIVIMSLSLIVFFYSCDNSVDSEDNNNNIVFMTAGTVYTDSSIMRGYFLINSDRVYFGTKRLFPSNIPDDFKQEGIRVVFSGKLVPCPPNAMCAALEIQLSSIKKL